MSEVLATETNAEVIWLTGATSGIGRELCLQLVAQGHRVIASGRNEQALAQLASRSTNVVPLAFDVGDTQSRLKAEARLASITSYLDRVIVNAGCCEYMKFPGPDWSSIDRVMNVNYNGAVDCVRMALPLLKNASGRGHVVGIVSQVVSAPFPQAEAYGASKAALSYFLDSLRIDLADCIDVTSIFPGFVKTPLTDRNHFSMPFIMSVEDAAERIVLQLNKRPSHYVFPKRLHWLLKISKLSPSLWQRMVAADNQQQTNTTQPAREK